MTNVLKEAVFTHLSLAMIITNVPMILVVKKLVNVNTLHTYATIPTNVLKMVVIPRVDVPSPKSLANKRTARLYNVINIKDAFIPI
jgi:hypothetical protein